MFDFKFPAAETIPESRSPRHQRTARGTIRAGFEISQLDINWPVPGWEKGMGIPLDKQHMARDLLRHCF